jgi:hypothetical protein
LTSISATSGSAVARSLSDLSHRLLDAATGDLEQVIGERARLVM